MTFSCFTVLQLWTQPTWTCCFLTLLKRKRTVKEILQHLWQVFCTTHDFLFNGNIFYKCISIKHYTIKLINRLLSSTHDTVGRVASIILTCQITFDIFCQWIPNTTAWASKCSCMTFPFHQTNIFHIFYHLPVKEVSEKKICSLHVLKTKGQREVKHYRNCRIHCHESHWKAPFVRNNMSCT